jgi:hypothetical protein
VCTVHTEIIRGYRKWLGNSSSKRWPSADHFAGRRINVAKFGSVPIGRETASCFEFGEKAEKRSEFDHFHINFYERRRDAYIHLKLRRLWLIDPRGTSTRDEWSKPLALHHFPEFNLILWSCNARRIV